MADVESLGLDGPARSRDPRRRGPGHTEIVRLLLIAPGAKLTNYCVHLMIRKKTAHRQKNGGVPAPVSLKRSPLVMLSSTSKNLN